jgi:hypothetical protein
MGRGRELLPGLTCAALLVCLAAAVVLGAVLGDTDLGLIVGLACAALLGVACIQLWRMRRASGIVVPAGTPPA